MFIFKNECVLLCRHINHDYIFAVCRTGILGLCRTRLCDPHQDHHPLHALSIVILHCRPSQFHMSRLLARVQLRKVWPPGRFERTAAAENNSSMSHGDRLHSQIRCWEFCEPLGHWIGKSEQRVGCMGSNTLGTDGKGREGSGKDQGVVRVCTNSPSQKYLLCIASTLTKMIDTGLRASHCHGLNTRCTWI